MTAPWHWDGEDVGVFEGAEVFACP